MTTAQLRAACQQIVGRLGRARIPAALATVWAYIGFPHEETGVGQCITLTRIGIEVLQRFGVKARPLPCELFVANTLAMRLALEGVPASQWPEEAYSLGVAANADGREGWNAHLAIEWQVGEQQGILDLDIARYSRPRYGIVVEPRPVVPSHGTGGTWWRAGPTAWVRWTPARHLSGFKKTPAWRAPVPFVVMEKLVSLMEHVELSGSTASPEVVSSAA